MKIRELDKAGRACNLGRWPTPDPKIADILFNITVWISGKQPHLPHPYVAIIRYPR